jgi:hypothetical protein
MQDSRVRIQESGSGARHGRLTDAPERFGLDRSCFTEIWNLPFSIAARRDVARESRLP